MDNPQSQANLQQASLRQTGLGYQVYFTVYPELTGRYGIRQIGFFFLFCMREQVEIQWDVLCH